MRRHGSVDAPIDIPDRLLFLDRGKHEPNGERGCVMEAASWLAGERWSDHPRSVHPVIARVARQVNDELDDAERQLLWPLVLASLNTSRRVRLRLHRRLERYRRDYAQPGGRELWESLLARHAELTGQHLPADWIAITSAGVQARQLDSSSGD